MSLSVSSNSSYLRLPPASLQAGVSTPPVVGAAPTAALLSETAGGWSWVPPAVRSARRDASVASLMALLSDITNPASGLSAQEGSDRGASGFRPPRDEAGSPPTPSSGGSFDDASTIQAADIVHADPTANPASAEPTSTPAVDEISSDVELKLEALFRTLQAYGL